MPVNRIMVICGKAITVIRGKPVTRTDPQTSVMVKCHSLYLLVRQPVGTFEMGKMEAVCHTGTIRCGSSENAANKKYDQFP